MHARFVLCSAGTCRYTYTDIYSYKYYGIYVIYTLNIHCIYILYTLCITRVCYGVATISRLLKIMGLFCKRALKKRQYSAKETYNFKEPTNRSHPITESRLYSNFFQPVLCRHVSFIASNCMYRHTHITNNVCLQTQLSRYACSPYVL